MRRGISGAWTTTRTEDPRADFTDLLLDPMTERPVAAACTFERTRWQVLDPDYAAELETANAVLNRTERLMKLAVCEKRLLAAMPFLPLYHAAWGYLCKPFIRGLTGHPFDVRAFKYVWIDTNWRQQ